MGQIVYSPQDFAEAATGKLGDFQRCVVLRGSAAVITGSEPHLERDIELKPNRSTLQPKGWQLSFFQSAGIILAAAVIGLMVNALRPGRLPLIADWSMQTQISTLQTTENPEVSVEEAKAIFESRSATFVDARPREFFDLGHIEGALSLPMEDFENRFDEVMANISPDATIITYCDGDSCALSKELAEALLAKGFLHVRVLLNGWTKWQEAALPVTSDQ